MNKYDNYILLLTALYFHSCSFKCSNKTQIKLHIRQTRLVLTSGAFCQQEVLKAKKYCMEKVCMETVCIDETLKSSYLKKKNRKYGITYKAFELLCCLCFKV